MYLVLNSHFFVFLCVIMKLQKRVLLGMSGGTDSSVCAMKLLDAGYEVVGVTFRFYERDNDTQYLDDARMLADRLGIEHLTVDVRERFQQEIVNYFVEEYMAGRTPVPCTLCNNQFKWPLLAQIADEKGIFYISTGHYVRKVCRDNLYYLAPAKDADKDQSFFLWGLSQSILSRMVLPMGDITRQEAAEYAQARGFAQIATKRNSIGVCFCPLDYHTFLTSQLPPERFPGEGRFVDENGHFMGVHQGYPFYTVGQRRGLRLQLNRAIFVKELLPERNEVVLAPLSSLYKKEMQLKDWHLHDAEKVFAMDEVIVKIRYRKQANRCRIALDGDNLFVSLLEPLESIAKGQAAAFYDKEGLLLGGGIIC